MPSSAVASLGVIMPCINHFSVRPHITPPPPPAVPPIELFVCGSPPKSNIPPSHAELESMHFHSGQKRRSAKRKAGQVHVDHKFAVNVRLTHTSWEQWKQWKTYCPNGSAVVVFPIHALICTSHSSCCRQEVMALPLRNRGGPC